MLHHKIREKVFQPSRGKVDKLWHKLGPIPTSPVQGGSWYNLGHTGKLYQLLRRLKNLPINFQPFRGHCIYTSPLRLHQFWSCSVTQQKQKAVDINYDLNYTNSPALLPQNITGISTGGGGRETDGMRPPDFGQEDAYTLPPTTGPNICIMWYILSHFLKNLLATLARLHCIIFLFQKL